MSTVFDAVATRSVAATTVSASTVSSNTVGFASYTTSTRPTGATAGTVIYNSALKGLELFDGGQWRAVSGAGASVRIQQNTAPFTLASGTIYPLTLGGGITNAVPVVEFDKGSLIVAGSGANRDGAFVPQSQSTTLEFLPCTVQGYITLSNTTAAPIDASLTVDFCTVDATGARTANRGSGEQQIITLPANNVKVSIPFILQDNLPGAGANAWWAVSVSVNSANLQTVVTPTICEYAVTFG